MTQEELYLRALTYGKSALDLVNHALKYVKENYKPDVISSVVAIVNRIETMLNLAMTTTEHQTIKSEETYMPGDEAGLHHASLKLILFRGYMIEANAIKLANEANDIRSDIIRWFKTYYENT